MTWFVLFRPRLEKISTYLYKGSKKICDMSYSELELLNLTPPLIFEERKIFKWEFFKNFLAENLIRKTIFFNLS